MASSSRGRRYLSDNEIAEQIGTSGGMDEDINDLENLHGEADYGWQDGAQEDTEEQQQDVEQEVDSDDSDQEVEQNVEDNDNNDNGPQRKRKKKLKDRLVNCLQASLDIDNYDSIELPEENKEASAVLIKKTRNNPATNITFQNHKSVRVGRQSAANVIRTEGGVMPSAADALTELDCWKLFIDPSILTDITLRTNVHIDTLLDNLPPEKIDTIKKKNTYVCHTTEEEILAYFGLMYMRGHFQWNYWELKRVWSSHPLFSATMSLHRFWFLNHYLILDDRASRGERWKVDRFAAAREIYERWNDNCACALHIGEYCAIDECQYATRMQVGFKTYNPSKPAKYGLLFKCINEVVYPFTHRSEAFAGKPKEEGGLFYFKTTEEITLRLVDKVRQRQDLRGRNLTTDNLYTSIPLAKKLLDRKMTLVGTMRHNRIGLPKEVKTLDNREEFSTEVWWEKEGKITFTSYVVKTKSKGKKNIVVLSTMEPLLGVTKDDDKFKPAIIKFYDFR